MEKGRIIVCFSYKILGGLYWLKKKKKHVPPVLLVSIHRKSPEFFSGTMPGGGQGFFPEKCRGEIPRVFFQKNTGGGNPQGFFLRKNTRGKIPGVFISGKIPAGKFLGFLFPEKGGPGKIRRNQRIPI